MPSDYQLYTRIEGCINGELVKSDAIYHQELPVHIKRYREALIKQSGRKPWAIFIRVNSSMKAPKARTEGFLTELDKQINAVAKRRGIDVMPADTPDI